MWIRSQNEKVLLNTSLIETIGEDDNIIVVSITGRNKAFPIGKYSSNDKALKVLELIKKELGSYFSTNGGPLLVQDGYVQPYSFIPPKVFEMPQDGEVVVDE